MKQMLCRGAVASALAATSLLIPLAGSANAANAFDGKYCMSTDPSGGCTAGWTADIPGSFAGVTTGSWEIDQRVCLTNAWVDLPECSWVQIDRGGPGPFHGSPGQLQDQYGNNAYELIITGAGSGAIGNLTGGSGPV